VQYFTRGVKYMHPDRRLHLQCIKFCPATNKSARRLKYFAGGVEIYYTPSKNYERRWRIISQMIGEYLEQFQKIVAPHDYYIIYILLARVLISLAHRPRALAHLDTTMHDWVDSANLKHSQHQYRVRVTLALGSDWAIGDWDCTMELRLCKLQRQLNLVWCVIWWFSSQHCSWLRLWENSTVVC